MPDHRVKTELFLHADFLSAAGILERAGHRGISVIGGGLDAWRRLGRPVKAGD